MKSTQPTAKGGAGRKKNMSILVHALDAFPAEAHLPFDPEAPEFSLRKAQALLALARLVYEEPGPVEAALSGPPWEISTSTAFRFLSRKNAQMFLFRKGSALILSFRGTETENFWDWRVDADVIQCVDRVLGPEWGKVHRGFSTALDEIWPELAAEVRQGAGTGPLWVTGHSLGAALAELASARLAVTCPHAGPVNLYAFGKPKIGDAQYARMFKTRFENRAFAFANHRDIVPRLPPAAWNYAPTGRLLYIGPDHRLDPDRPTLEEIEGETAAHLERIVSWVRHPKMAKLVRLLEKPHGGSLWNDIGAVLEHIPVTLLDSLRALMPGAVADHFPSEYLKALQPSTPGHIADNGSGQPATPGDR